MGWYRQKSQRHMKSSLASQLGGQGMDVLVCMSVCVIEKDGEVRRGERGERRGGEVRE